MLDPLGDPPWQLRALLPRFRSWRRKGRKEFLLASSWPGEARSEVAVHLAHQAALSQLRVLLIDANLGSATLTQRFQALGPGWTDWLQGRDFELTRLSQDLELLGVGLHGPGFELRLGPDSVDRFRELTGSYDLVLVDAPALSVSTLALSLAGLCEGVILVASKRHYRDRRDDSLAERFLVQGTRVLGVVVTDEDALSTDWTAVSSLPGHLLTALGLRP